MNARFRDSAVTASPQRRRSLVTAGCPPTASPGSSAPHPLPLAGKSLASLFRAHQRAPRPERVLTDLTTRRRSFRRGRPPQRPVVGHSRVRGGTTHPGPRPCQASFRSIGSATAPSGWSNIRAIPSRPSTDTLRCAGLFARTRTEVRAWRHPQASRGQEVYRVPPTRHRAGAA